MAPRLIKRRTLTDEVADTIREMILVGDLRPSRRFTQQELADMVGVSTMPVREALLRLSHDGLIIAKPNRSYQVTLFTPEDIQDIYWMRSTIEGELTARACRNADKALLSALRNLNESLGKSGNGAVGVDAATHEFHRLINQAARSPQLVHVILSTNRMVADHLHVLTDWAKVSKRAHEQILQAFLDRNPEAARAAAIDHVLDGCRVITKHLSSSGYWNSGDQSDKVTRPSRARRVTRKRVRSTTKRK